MIEIRVTPARVEAVRFLPSSDLEEDLDLAAWQLIRPLVDRIDRRVRRAAEAALSGAPERCAGCGKASRAP
jgi:hypothetical protein